MRHVARDGLTAGSMVEVRPAGEDGGGGGGGGAPITGGASVAVEPVLGISDGDALEIAR